MNAAVINRKAKLQRVQEACSDTNWSRNTLMKVRMMLSEQFHTQELFSQRDIAEMLDISEQEAVEQIEKAKSELLEQGEDMSKYIISEPKRQKFILSPQKWTS